MIFTPLEIKDIIFLMSWWRLVLQATFPELMSNSWSKPESELCLSIIDFLLKRNTNWWTNWMEFTCQVTPTWLWPIRTTKMLLYRFWCTKRGSNSKTVTISQCSWWETHSSHWSELVRLQRVTFQTWQTSSIRALVLRWFLILMKLSSLTLWPERANKLFSTRLLSSTNKLLELPLRTSNPMRN